MVISIPLLLGKYWPYTNKTRRALRIQNFVIIPFLMITIQNTNLFYLNHNIVFEKGFSFMQIIRSSVMIFFIFV